MNCRELTTVLLFPDPLSVRLWTVDEIRVDPVLAVNGMFEMGVEECGPVNSPTGLLALKMLPVNIDERGEFPRGEFPASFRG